MTPKAIAAAVSSRSKVIRNSSGFNEAGTDCPSLSNFLSVPLPLFLSRSILPLSFIRTYKYVRASGTHVELNFALTKVRDKGKERTDERTGYWCSESLNRTCVVLSAADSRTLTSACIRAHVQAYVIKRELRA